MSSLQVFCALLAEFAHGLQHVAPILLAHFDVQREAGNRSQFGEVPREALKRLERGLHCGFQYRDVAGKRCVARTVCSREFVVRCHVWPALYLGLGPHRPR